MSKKSFRSVYRFSVKKLISNLHDSNIFLYIIYMKPLCKLITAIFLCYFVYVDISFII